MIKARNGVVCVEASTRLRGELRARRLVVDSKDIGDASITTSLAAGRTTLRAIVVGVQGLADRHTERKVFSFLRSLADLAARDNLSVVLEGLDRHARERGYQLLRAACGTTYDAHRTYVSALDAAAAAQRILDFHPGPHWWSLPLTGGAIDGLQVEEKDLIRRAVSDAMSANVERIGTKNIYRVDACMPDAPDRHPFLVKMVDSRKRAAIEGGNYARFCVEAIPYFSLPPISPQRCASGTGRECLVYHFADHAITLAEAIRTRSPVRAIAALFDGALRQWRADVRQQQVALGDYLFDKNIVSARGESYDEAYEHTKRDGGPVARKADQILESVRGYPQRAMRICMSHGDLHARNVLCNEGAEEVSLIDFARTGYAPATVDPAELEASLAFLKISGVPELTPDEIERLYSGRPFAEPQLARAANKRALGIQQVRRQVACEVDQADYANTLAASLLFYARKSAGAFRAADWLSQVRP